MSKELGSQLDIEHLYMEGIITEIGQHIKPRTYTTKPLVQVANPSVKDKIRSTGRHYYAFKDPIRTTHKGKASHCKNKER